MSVSVIEFFAGIGGLAAAWPEAEIRAAIDINQNAACVYQRNFPHPFSVRAIESLTSDDLARLNATMWWMSPPCQPFSRRGAQRDIQDNRTLGLLNLIELLEDCRPSALAVENVVGFEKSQACAQLTRTMKRCGYQVQTRTLCPTELGWPNLRPRFYLLASRQRLHPWRPLPQYHVSLQDFVQGESSLCEDQELWLTPAQQARFESALDRVSLLDATPRTACFSSSYGKTILHAGSYLKVGERYRRFTPTEVARLLGFDDRFRLGDGGLRANWKLLGNSLSLPAVRYFLSHLPDGPPPRLRQL